MRITTLKQRFETEKCMTCEHPKGCHGPNYCWSYGLVDPKCRKKCTGFKRDNLKWLEGEFKKHANTSKVQRLRP